MGIKWIKWLLAWPNEKDEYVLDHPIDLLTRFGWIHVPLGFRHDGMTWFPNGPNEELLDDAAIHDFGYKVAWFKRRQHDILLKRGIEIKGKTPKEKKQYKLMAKIVYSGVRTFGWVPWSFHRLKGHKSEERQAMAAV